MESVKDSEMAGSPRLAAMPNQIAPALKSTGCFPVGLGEKQQNRVGEA